MKTLYATVICLGIIALILQITTIFVSNNIASDSIYASELAEKIDNLDEKNLSLRSEVLHFSSFEIISQQAIELGFVTPKNFISLHTPLHVAITQ